jgi:hypothetical protein
LEERRKEANKAGEKLYNLVRTQKQRKMRGKRCRGEAGSR